jgi:hypothetical protein
MPALRPCPPNQDLFKYIGRYRPAAAAPPAPLKPFVPDYIPALGGIDEFLKVGCGVGCGVGWGPGWGVGWGGVWGGCGVGWGPGRGAGLGCAGGGARW